MSSLKKLAGETALYGVSSILGRILNYLLVPLYTAVFVAQEYGIVTELYAYVAFLNVIYVYGLETAYFRYSNKEGYGETNAFNTCVTSILLTSLLFSGSLIYFSGPLSSAIDYPGQSHLIVWLALIMGIDAVVAIPFARLRLEGKAKLFVLAKLSSICLNIGLNILFIAIAPGLWESGELSWLTYFYRPDWGIEYVFISNLVANAFLFLFLFRSFHGYQPSLDRKLWKELIIYAFPLLFTGLAGVTNEMMSRALLKHWLPEGFYPGQSNLTALGIFGACYKLSVFMTLAVQAFRYAAEPFFFANASNKESPELFARVAHWFIIFAAFAFLGISINLDLLGFLFLRSPEYREALYVVPYLLLGGLFLGIYYNLSVWYKLADKTFFGAVISGIGALITITANIALIPLQGYLGSAIATLFTYLLMTVISYVMGRKYLPIPYKVSKALVYIMTGAALVIVNRYLMLEEVAVVIFVRLFTLLLYLAMVYLGEKGELHHLLKGRRAKSG